MCSRCSRTVSAIDFVRRLPGKSQAALVEASDHHQYVVKWMNAPRAIICLRMEALRNSVYELLGLPVSAWTPIEVSDQLIDAAPEMRIHTAIGPVRPVAGIHFASRVVCDPPETSYEALQPHLYDRVVNRLDFWGAYTLDVWTERFDVRQAVFAPSGNSGELKAFFIDHGNSSGCMRASRETGFVPCLYPDKRIYVQEEMIAVIHEWILHVQRNGRSAIQTAYERMPPDWRTASVEALGDQFTDRIRHLRDLIFPPIQRVPVKARFSGSERFPVRMLLRVGQIA